MTLRFIVYGENAEAIEDAIWDHVAAFFGGREAAEARTFDADYDVEPGVTTAACTIPPPTWRADVVVKCLDPDRKVNR